MKLANTIKGKLNKLNKNLKNSNNNDDDQQDANKKNDSENSHQVPTLNSTGKIRNNSTHSKLSSYETHIPSPLQQMSIHRDNSKTSFSYPHDLTNDELDLNSNFTDDEYDEDDDYDDVDESSSCFNLIGTKPLTKVMTYPESISRGVTFYKPLNKEQEDRIQLDLVKLTQYKDLLDKASNANTTILLELELDGSIRYLSDHLFILHSKEHLVGQDISNFLAGSEKDKKVFHRTIELLLRDDESYKVRFFINAKPNGSSSEEEDEGLIGNLPPVYYHLEAQGVLIHDMFTNAPSFTMWIIKPIFDIDELDELPNQLVEKLGFGATIFNKRLDNLDGIYELQDVPPDKTEICRICETEVADWWLETHCRMCLYEHNLYDKIAFAEEELKDIKKSLVELKKKLDSPDSSPVITAKNYEISVSDLHIPALFSTLNLFIDFCDDALTINNSELKMLLENSSLYDVEFQFSPNSQHKIQKVQDWKQRLMTLVSQIEEDVTESQDTLKLILWSNIKSTELRVTRLVRLKHTEQYHMRLKTEIFILTNEVIRQRIQSNILNSNVADNTSFPALNPDLDPVTLAATCNEASDNYYQSPDFTPDDSINSALLNKHFLENDNKIPMLSVTKSIDGSLTPNQSNKEIFVSANEAEGNSDYDVSNKFQTVQFNNSNEMFSSSTNNSTPNRPRADSDINVFSLSGSMSPNTTGGNSIPHSECAPRTNSIMNIPNISVASSILKRRSSASSMRHTNSGIKRGSPLVTNTKPSALQIPMLSVIQKNPTTKSVFVKSPLTSPFLHAVESASSLTNLNNASMSLNQSVNSAPLELHKTSIGSVIAPGTANSRPGSKVPTPNSANKSQSSSSILTASTSNSHSTPKIMDYDIVKPISKGAFGSVFLAKRKITGDYVSIKCLKKADMISKNQVTNVKTERVIMMTQINKSYVAHLYATFQNKDHLFLVMEYLIGGDLRTLIKMVGSLPSKWIKQYTSEIIFGVADMHKDGIIHHDLKPDNMLLDRNGHVKFIDFGLSRIGLLNRQRRKESAQPNQSNHYSNSGTKNVSRSLHQSIYSSPQGSFSNLLGLNKSKADSSVRKNSDDLKSESNSSISSAPYSSSNNFTNADIVEASLLKSDDTNLSFSLNKDGNQSDRINNFLNNINENGTIPRSTAPTAKINHSSESSSEINHKTSVDPISNYVIFDPDKTNKNFKFMGTPDYIAPEVIKGERETAMCDWWSVGCIFFEFHFAIPPFNGNSPSEVFQNILKCNIKWPEFDDEEEESLYISPEAKDLILKLLVLDPTKRLGYNSIDEIKFHPYFDDLDWDNVYQEEAEFVPNVNDPEDTDYFDNRGLSMNIDFQEDDRTSSEESEKYNNEKAKLEETESSNPKAVTVGSLLNSSNSKSSELNKEKIEALYNGTAGIPKETNNSFVETKKSLKQDKGVDFGAFNFRNIHALHKANKEVINRLRNEHMGSASGESSSSSLKHHQKSASLSGLFGTMINPPSSSLSLVLSDQQKNDFSNSPNSDFEDSKQDHTSLFSPNADKSGDSASFDKMANGSDNLDPIQLTLTPEVKFKLTNLDDSKIPENMNLLLQEEQRLEAVSKLQNVRKSRKFSSVAQSLTGNNSRRASGSSNSTSGYTNHNHYDTSASSSIFNSFNKNTMSFNLDVLVCESIPIHSYLMKKNLEQFGCRVVNVSNGDELVRRATSDVKFDLIFSTFFSSKLNCVDIFKLIRNTNGANCNTPFIVITAYYQEALKLNLFDSVLEKPVSVTQMRSILSKYALKKAQENEDTLLSDVESEIFYDTKIE